MHSDAAENCARQSMLDSYRLSLVASILHLYVVLIVIAVF